MIADVLAYTGDLVITRHGINRNQVGKNEGLSEKIMQDQLARIGTDSLQTRTVTANKNKNRVHPNLVFLKFATEPFKTEKLHIKCFLYFNIFTSINRHQIKSKINGIFTFYEGVEKNMERFHGSNLYLY